MNKRDLILSGPIPSTLVSLTIPMVGGIIATFIFNLADTYFVGLLGTRPLAAVSFTFPVTMLVLNLAIGLSIGVSALVSKAIGAGDTSETQRLVTHSLFYTFLFTIITVIAGFLGLPWLFGLLGIQPELLPLTLGYMHWWLLGIVGFLFMVVANGAIRASGNTRLPGQVMIVSALLNIVLDPLLIFGLGPIPAMGVEGAAIASLISWYLVTIPLLVKLIKDEFLAAHLVVNKLWSDFKNLMATALPAIGTNTLGPLASMVIIGFVAKEGEAAVAAFGVGSRLEPFALLVVLAMTASMPPFVGQNFGAKNYQRIVSALKTALQFVLLWQLLVYALLAAMSIHIATAFSDDPLVIELIQLFLFIVPVTYVGVGTVLIINSTLNAMQKAEISLAITLVRLFVFYIPACWIGAELNGIRGIFVGAAVANILIGLFAYLMIFKIVRERSGKFSQQVMDGK